MIEEMKPILFNTEMVRAILDGRKTQFRRVVKDKVSLSLITLRHGNGLISNEDEQYLKNDILLRSPYKKDDILYVKETWQEKWLNYPNSGIMYKASSETYGHWLPETIIWRPSIHMPKKYARIFLLVTNIRVERLQNISHDDIYAEGLDWKDFECDSGSHANDIFEWWKILWNSTAKDGYKWEDNPYVFVYEFERVEKPSV